LPACPLSSARRHVTGFPRSPNPKAAMCRVQLVGGHAQLGELAERALNATTEIHYAADEEDRMARGQKARLAAQDFLIAASADHGTCFQRSRLTTCATGAPADQESWLPRTS